MHACWIILLLHAHYHGNHILHREKIYPLDTMPLYYAQAICSIFGRKHALLLCPSNLQLFWTPTSPTTMSIEFSVFLDANIHAICSFLDANMPYYPAHAIYSFFGRKHALLRSLYNLQLFWTQTCTITMPMQFAAFLDAQICGKY